MKNVSKAGLPTTVCRITDQGTILGCVSAEATAARTHALRRPSPPLTESLPTTPNTPPKPRRVKLAEMFKEPTPKKI